MTTIITTQSELEALIVNGLIRIAGDLEIKCGVSVDANINAKNIKAYSISARDIRALDIKAYNIDALDIDAKDINAADINAGNIKADDISYYALCMAYNNIACESIKGRRKNAKHFCLDGKITINKGK